MNRHVLGILLAIGIVAVTTQTSVFCEDKVVRQDRTSGKVESVGGKILDENLAGVKLKVGTKEVSIPSTEISRVFYEDMPVASKQAYINLWNLEDTEKDPAKVLKAYQDFLPKMTGAPAQIRRNVDYRIISLQVATAESKEQKTEARKALQAFVAGNNASWQYPFAARSLARLQIDAAKSEPTEYDAAQRTLEGITKSASIPPELRQEADMMLVDVLFQSGKTEDVKNKITAALGDPKTTEQQKNRFTVYQTAIEAQAPNAKIEEVIKKLEDIIAKSNDNAVKALAYNVMGDCYLRSMIKDAKRYAMWSYLWVDVVYNQDRAEHIKAMNSLLKIFEEEKDEEKKQLYKDKLSRIR